MLLNDSFKTKNNYNKTVLVVDDDITFIKTIIEQLNTKETHYKVLTCANSSLVDTICQKTLPDIIILDWDMPELSGLEVLNILKLNINTREIPVIITTGIYLTSENLKIALENGAVDFIRKPFDEVELIARINSAITVHEFYKNKLEFEKKLISINEEIFKQEIDTKKRELLSKSLLLIKFNELFKEYEIRLKEVKGNSHLHDDCTVFKIAEQFIKDTIKISNQQIWKELEFHFEKYNDEFYKHLLVEFPNLTPNELKLCAYLKLNLSTKDVSIITNQTIRSIEVARARLREKIGLKGTDTDLYSFLNSLK